MATTEKFFIEKLEDGTTLNTDGSWELFTPDTSSRSFTDRASAVTHIDNLDNGDYRVFSRITKSS